MDNTIKIMATGLKYRTQSMNITANNIANANTNGFKRSELTAGEFETYISNRIDAGEMAEIGNENRGVEATGVYTDERRGDLYVTDSMFDLALDGDGSFTLEGAGGGQILSRDGHFQVGADGYLIDSRGNYVLGENGRIYVGQGYMWVSEAGNIYINGRRTDRFRINAAGGFNGRVMQRVLERSNVRPLDEMMKMMEDSRAFQTYSQIVIAADKILQKTVTEIGRV